MLTARDEPPIDELQHLHWNCFLVKTLAFESTANRNFFSNTGDALIFQPDVVISLPPDLCRTTSPGLKSVFIESLWEGRRSTLVMRITYHAGESGRAARIDPYRAI
jgi:hypothetical protein